MGKILCQYCEKNPCKLKRAKNDYKTCLECFYYHFEEEVYQTLLDEQLFEPNDRIILAISGGKDSTVLVHVMTRLKERHNLPIELELLAIDEGIVGYRDDSLVTVRNNQKFYNLPLTILDYKTLFGKTMDEVVSLTHVKTSCTYCGVFRRKALNVGLEQLKGNKLYTGHNADDMAETILMNILRGDAFRLVNCTCATSGEKGELQRCKPFKFAYEKEIKLEYFSTECTYSKDAFRGHLKELMKDMMTLKPGIIVDIIKQASSLKLNETYKNPEKRFCEKCGDVSSNKICKSCFFIDDLKKIAQTKKQKLEIEQLIYQNCQKRLIL